jgi:apolipoprotein N-acyltransferase
MADLITEFVSPENGKKQIDFLVNISNDGWFNHSCELLQHLYICAFRAVENRISIARSVNTGVSGFIDPSGRIIDMVTDGARVYGKGIRGYSSQTIPVDSRVTIYSKWKDVPLKGILTLIVLAGILRKKFHHRSGGLSHD